MSAGDGIADAKLRIHSPVNLSWTYNKNRLEIPKMIERKPGENFVGKFATHASYDLPTCIGELMYSVPTFTKMSGRARRLHGNLLKDMNSM
jgi:hypothetical protein